MSDSEDITGTEFDEQLQHVHLGELDVVDLRINELLDMSEELMGVISARADDTIGLSRVPWDVSRTVFR